MFENLVESSAQRRGTKKWLYFSITAVIWVTVLTAAIVIGIVRYDAQLNEQFEALTLLAPAPPPPPPPPPPPAAVIPKVVVPTGFVAAKEPPKEIKPPNPTPPVIVSSADMGVQGAIGTGPGSPNGVLGSYGPSEVAPPPPPPPPKPEATPTPIPKIIRKSGGVLQGSALRRVEPSYPPLAKAARVTGTVVVEITIDEDGNVISAHALSGHPLLRDAAVSAARGWKFAPTKLSGVPVKVIGTITFNFEM